MYYAIKPKPQVSRWNKRGPDGRFIHPDKPKRDEQLKGQISFDEILKTMGRRCNNEF